MLSAVPSMSIVAGATRGTDAGDEAPAGGVVNVTVVPAGIETETLLKYIPLLSAKL